jgi:16S rRNA G966 N2-methylase RsmD
VFVEQAKAAIEPLRVNLAEVRRRAAQAGITPEPLDIVATDVARCWNKVSSATPRFDIIWADPPYRDALTWAATILAESRSIIKPGGILVIESGESLESLTPADWKMQKPRHYGETHVTLWRRDTPLSYEDPTHVAYQD